jgi:hypothetical protein
VPSGKCPVLHDVPSQKTTIFVSEVIANLALHSRGAANSTTGMTTIARRMASSGMLRRVALVRTDVSDDLSASFIRLKRIGELGTTRRTSQLASVASYS